MWHQAAADSPQFCLSFPVHDEKFPALPKLETCEWSLHTPVISVRVSTRLFFTSLVLPSFQVRSPEFWSEGIYLIAKFCDLNFFFFYYITYAHVCLRVWTCLWRSEDNFRKSVLSSHVGPGDQIQVVGLGGVCFILNIESREPLGISEAF